MDSSPEPATHETTVDHNEHTTATTDDVSPTVHSLEDLTTPSHDDPEAALPHTDIDSTIPQTDLDPAVSQPDINDEPEPNSLHSDFQPIVPPTEAKSLTKKKKGKKKSSKVKDLNPQEDLPNTEENDLDMPLGSAELAFILSIPDTPQTADQTVPEANPVKISKRSRKPVTAVPDREAITNSVRLMDLDPSPSKLHMRTPSASLLKARFDNLNHSYLAKDDQSRSTILAGTENIKRTFNSIRDAVGELSEMFAYNIDWEFWTRLVNDYENVLQNEPEQLGTAILSGIPKEFRGIVWQLVARSKNFALEELYMLLKNEPSVHEKSIKRDLTRTSFFSQVEQVRKGTELFSVIKAYSLFDPDVGYTQGMIFIAVPLIMNISEAECFSLLVTLMKDYGLRDLFCPEMRGLHLLLYKFDRLLEARLPLLYNHLAKQDIKSSMYASQWFLTFFAYKFPLNFVLRIYDIVITQGMEAILKFAINLMLKNEQHILGLKFDKLLEFLKDELFNSYLHPNAINPEPHSGSSTPSNRLSTILTGGARLSGLSAVSRGQRGTGQDKYDLDEYVLDLMSVDIEPAELSQYEVEFDAIYQDELSKVSLIEEMRLKNGQLRNTIKQLELKYLQLNHEHSELVQNMVQVQVSLPALQESHHELSASIQKLRAAIQVLEEKNTGDSTETVDKVIPESIEQNIQELLQENARQAELCANLEDEITQLSQEDETLQEELKVHSKKWFGRW